jgi:opacity protein-like surface antigen
MGTWNALTLAGALALAPQFAAAADLLPPPPPLEAPLRGTFPEDSGWYLRGDVGVGITHNSVEATYTGIQPVTPAFVQHEIGDTAFVGLGAGYQFNNWFRADLTGEYRIGAQYSGIESYGPPPLNYDTYHGTLRSSVFLANGYVDLGTWWRVTPFFGLGVGFAHHNFSGFYDIAPNGGFGFAPDHGTNSFAWALMAGFGYQVNRHLRLEVGYRYLDMGHAQTGTITCTAGCTLERDRFHVASHDIRVGMRWMLGDSAPAVTELPPPPPPPLVRKY